MFGWKGSPGLFNHLHIPSADVAIVYELVVGLTVISSVVGFAHSQEVGSQVPSHHLASIYKDVSGKKSKCKHSCEERLKIVITETSLENIAIPERERHNDSSIVYLQQSCDTKMRSLNLKEQCSAETQYFSYLTQLPRIK